MTKAARNEAIPSKSETDEPKGRPRDAVRKPEEASDGIRRFRKVILLVLAFVVAVVLLFSLVSSLKQRRTEELAARFYEVLTEPVASGEEPDLAAVDAVLEDAEGRSQEQWFLRATVEYLLTAADTKDAEKRRAASAAAASPGADPGAADDSGSTLTAEAARAKARALVDSARDRIGSPAVDEWAANVLARLDGLASDSWRPPPREYEVRPPAGGSETSSEPAPSNESSSANEEQQSPDTSAGSEPPSGTHEAPAGEEVGAEEE